ncbi:Pentatricopeptide repeat [Dillenia turbinata]|uniref:Pentatricopeptide repeat n=1 Tax=Dillenia turbinata TaxID=194707 RepID=A0AAN8UUU3_9MAGN
MLNKEHGADSLVYNNLIKGFINLGNLDKANELFDEIKKRCCVYGGSVDATFIDWFFKQGREKEAMESYKSLLDQPSKMTLDTCNVLLELLLKHNRKTEAWALFHQMWKIRSPYVSAVTSDTFNIMVNGFFRLGNISEAFDVFKLNGLNRLATYNNIITRCCEHGMLEDAEKLFAEVGAKWVSPDVYRALIDAYFKQERIEDALQTFNKMVDVSLSELAGEPATSLFGELIKYGKVAETVPILTKMGRRNPKPDPTIYEVVVMGLCNNALLDEARDIVGQQMRYGVGVTPALRDCVLDTFGRAGRNEEIERLLEIERHGFVQLEVKYNNYIKLQI